MTNKIIIAEFAKFLKENHVFIQYRMNIGRYTLQKKPLEWCSAFKEKIILHYAKRGYINKELSLNLINYAFAWSETSQGHFFWSKLDKKWKKVLIEKKLYFNMQQALEQMKEQENNG